MGYSEHIGSVLSTKQYTVRYLEQATLSIVPY